MGGRGQAIGFDDTSERYEVRLDGAEKPNHRCSRSLRKCEWLHAAWLEQLKGHELSADDLMDEYVTCLREALYDLQR